MNTPAPAITLTIPELINIITALNLLVLFIVLFFRKQNTPPNRYLAFILLFPAISFINNYLVLSGYIVHFPSIVFISELGVIITVPMIYQYTRIFMGKKWNPYFILNILSFIAILVCLYCWITFLLKDTLYKNQFAVNIIREIFPDFLTYIRGSFFLLLNAYFLVIAIQVIQYSKRIMDIQSELERLKIRYLQQFIILIWILNIIILILYLLLSNYFVDFIAVPVVTGIFYIFLVRTAFNHTAVFTLEGFSHFKNSLSKVESLDVSRSGLKDFPDEEVDKIREKTDRLMKEEKIFVDPDLNIVKLSEALDLSVHQTSYFINNYLNSNFFNLINAQRIGMAKELMKQRGKKSEIEVIGFEVGFNSKSAFYRAFNKFVKQSPSEFIQNQ